MSCVPSCQLGRQPVLGTPLCPSSRYHSVPLPKGVTSPVPGSLPQQPPHPSPTTTLTPASHWPSILGTGAGNSREPSPTAGKACFHPPTGPRQPREPGPSPTRCTRTQRYLVQGQEGLHPKAHAADQFALPAGQPEFRDRQHTPVEAPDPPLHPFPGSPQTSLPMLGARQCPGRAPAPWREQARGNHRAQLQQGKEELG